MRVYNVVDDAASVLGTGLWRSGLIAELRLAGARIKLISDGDVEAAIATCKPESGE
jgi:fructose-1,6-bisphosphatase/sedoheptulose 1,7-bisphosphatase-like protein